MCWRSLARTDAVEWPVRRFARKSLVRRGESSSSLNLRRGRNLLILLLFSTYFHPPPLQEAVIIETYFVLTLSRLLLASPPAAFGHLLRSSLPRLAELQAQQPTSQPRFELSASAIYSQLISLFVTRFENMSTSKKRKVVAVGLASLLAKADPNFEDEREIYKGVPEMASIWSAVFAEIKDGEDG